MIPQEQTYTRVDGDEHGSAHDDASTSTDADESTIPLSAAGLDKSWEEFSSSAPRRRASRWATCCSSVVLQGLLNTVLLVVVLALLVDRRWHQGSQQRLGQFEGGGDITGFIPPVSQQIKTFVPDWGFVSENASEFFTRAAKDKWLSIVPKGLGYLHVKEPSKYNNLPHPLIGYEDIGTVFTTGVTHQLHCLYNILEVYSSLQLGEVIDVQMVGHIPHCFEYLRQSIMCAADTALEGQHTTFPKDVLGSDGWDSKHVCKNYDEVKAFLFANRADSMIWI